MSHIYLVGFRCTGKTTVGMALAQRLGRHFVDTDGFITGYAGASVSEIIAREGWERFRQLECFALEQIAEGDRLVVSTGGGVVLRPENVALMRKTGRVVWLKAGVGILANRMQGDAATAEQRPSLTQKGPLEEIAEVLEERAPFYGAASHLQIDTDQIAPEKVVEKIVKRLCK